MSWVKRKARESDKCSVVYKQFFFFNDQPRPQDKRIKNIITVKKELENG